MKMEKTTFAEISAVNNPANGEVTLFVSNVPWGPVVTGKNLSEAKAKLKEAFGMSMIANSYCDTINEDNKQIIKRFEEGNCEMEKMNKTLEFTYR